MFESLKYNNIYCKWKFIFNRKPRGGHSDPFLTYMCPTNKHSKLSLSTKISYYEIRARLNFNDIDIIFFNPSRGV